MLGLPISCDLKELERVWTCRKRVDHEEGVSEPVSLLVSMIHSTTEFNDVAATLKLSNKERNLGLFISDRRETAILENTSMRYFQDLLVDKVKHHWVLELVGYCNKMDYLSALRHWEVPVIPVTGRDLMAAGIQSGPRMGLVLQSLKAKWMDSGFVMSKEQLLETAKGERTKTEDDACKRRKLS